MRFILICVLSVFFTVVSIIFLIGLMTLVPLQHMVEKMIDYGEAHNGVLIGLGLIALGCAGLPLLKALAP